VKVDPYVFVVGSPRSGTTLLQRMFDAHPRLAVANDTHFIPRALIGIADHDVPLTHEVVERVIGYHRFHRLGIDADLARSLAVGADTYVGFVSALYSAFATARGKSMGGEKTPDYVRYIPLLSTLFPWARFVHIVRDGRDVTLSALEWASEGKGPGRFALWATEPVAVCALWWRRQVEPGAKAGTALGPDRYAEVRYEALVTDAEPELRILCSFLALEYSPRMEAFNEGRQVDGRSLDAKKAWLPATPGLRDWRATMSERDVALFEALAGETLAHYGYERMYPKIPAEIKATARRCASLWNEEKRIKGERAVAAGSPPPPR
jgi:hypothetical protein